MDLSYDVKKIEIKQRLAQWARRPDSDFARFQMTRQQAIELLWETSGRLVFPWDPEYEQLRLVAYPNFENVRPAAIGVCETLHDVKTFMKFIREQREANPAFTWVTRSGGHSTALFWAVRGGTGNQFGVLTRATYQLLPLREVGAVLLQWQLGTDEEAAQGAAALELMQRRYMGSNASPSSIPRRWTMSRPPSWRRRRSRPRRPRCWSPPCPACAGP